ncbi:serine carboxypeptidase-like 19 [Phalaenopsis equestris]|uniref:serine carboxypeptidase-like 19 n=1 Tax=Phalaenopsis equestris TaxID=78828 RepID=UPI0009E2E8DC|nr:serine carboxypeptidase-like 19 [Phalaenopsis equestris]
MGGNSYGGKITVLTAHKVVEGNEGGEKPLINIKGYLVGNAVTGDKVDTSSQAPHAYGLGIISKELYKLIMAHCAGEEDLIRPQNVLCATHLETFNGFLSEINSYNILDPVCSDEPPTSAMRSLRENPEEFISLPLSSIPDISCITAELLANYWGNHHLVKKALHVKEGTTERFHRCDFNVNSYYYTRSVPSTVPYHYSFITRGFRALEYTILFSNNLTFATVKGGSHVAPGKMPLECFAMFERWISHESL